MARNIFVAGATGVIGSRLLPMLVRRGFCVFGLTRAPSKAADLLSLGAIPLVGDVYDSRGLNALMRAARPDVVVHQLTDLPKGLDPQQIEQGIRRNARVRAEGTANVVAAAVAAGAQMVVAQSIAWAYAPGGEPHAESAPLDVDVGGLRGVTVAGVVALEKAVTTEAELMGVVLRYGQLYGPGTGLDNASNKKLPLHVDAAAWAVLLAIEYAQRGVFNIVETNSIVSSAKAVQELGWAPTPPRSDAVTFD
jgi:nucleoside-diphosphate-sugar epimerase